MSLVSTTTAPIDIKIDTSSLVLDGVLSASPSNLSTFDTQAIPKSEPPRGRRTRSPVVPPSLLKPGVDMLKVSVKSSRRIKSRKVWLETGTRVGNYGVDDVQICWEKSTRGVGPKRDTSIPISALRSIRYGSDISPYRTSLHLSPLVEPRWITLIYLLPAQPPPPLLLSLINTSSSQKTPVYKIIHLISPTDETFETWKDTLNGFLAARKGSGDDWAEINWREAGGGAEDETEEGEKKKERVEKVEVERVVREEEVLRLCKRLGMGLGKEEIASAFQKSAAPYDFLDFPSFQRFVKLLKRRSEVDEIFNHLSNQNPMGISRDGWSRFLLDVQQMDIEATAISAMFSKFTRPGEEYVSMDGLTSFLVSSDNAAVVDDSDQDMTRPLCEYYIASSHNTYLVGNQFQGDSTVEGYIRALQQGCRCVELDIWSGEDDSPIITHGRTLTTKISARDTIQAIARYAFLASSYPIILSLEIHCGVIQQDKLVEELIEAFGDRLVVERIDNEKGEEILRLPSPEDLRGKVLLKAKDVSIAMTTSFDQLAAALSADESGTSESSPSSDSDLKRVFNAVRRGLEERSFTPRGSISSDTSSPRVGSEGRSSPSTTRSSVAVPESQKSPLSPILASLLIYTIGVKPRGFNKKESYAPTHLLSFGENRWSRMVKDEGVRQDAIAHNRTHLSRGYPKGVLRVTSTNFLPSNLWAMGVQLAALNWQTFDIGMELNMAMFARAGRSGYVLKPEILRRKGLEKDKDALVRVSDYSLEIEIISAQQLPRPSSPALNENESQPMDPFVEVSIFVPNSSSPIKRRTKVVSGNAFNPIFRSSFTIPFSILPSKDMLALAFLRFEVLNARGNIKAANEEGKGEFVGAYCIGIGSLKSGYRHLPLYDKVGDQHLFSSLFIKSSVTLS